MACIIRNQVADQEARQMTTSWGRASRMLPLPFTTKYQPLSTSGHPSATQPHPAAMTDLERSLCFTLSRFGVLGENIRLVQPC